MRGLLGGWLSRLAGAGQDSGRCQASGLIDEIDLLSRQTPIPTAITLLREITRKLREPLIGLRILNEKAPINVQQLSEKLEQTQTRLDSQEWQVLTDL